MSMIHRRLYRPVTARTPVQPSHRLCAPTRPRRTPEKPCPARSHPRAVDERVEGALALEGADEADARLRPQGPWPPYRPRTPHTAHGLKLSTHICLPRRDFTKATSRAYILSPNVLIQPRYLREIRSACTDTAEKYNKKFKDTDVAAPLVSRT